MSSDMIHTCGCAQQHAAQRRRSVGGHAAPVGLFGKFSTSHLVRGVIARLQVLRAQLEAVVLRAGHDHRRAAHQRVISG